jgi:serine/threonine-protein kinase
MAVVYLAWDRKHDRHVALKVIRPDVSLVGAAERFSREIRLAARLQHPHILSVHDSGEAAGQLWYTMPFVEGESLRERLDREKQLPIGEAVRIAREAAQALAYAHQHAVIHRDVKPENLLLTKDGSVLVADFGIARALAGSGPATSAPSTEHSVRLTETGMAIGTPAYMAPETRLGAPADARSDIYSLSAVLFEMLTGRLAAGSGGMGFDLFLPDTMPLVRAARADVPEGLDALVRRGLHPNPDQRFATMEDMARGLGEASSDAPRKRNKSTVAVPLTILIILMLAAAAGWALFRHTPADPAAVPEASVAVLPFTTIGGDTTQNYFAQGMADELTTALVQSSDIRVASQSGIARLAAGAMTAQQAGRELGVRAVVEGTVRRQGNQLRVTTQLTSVADGSVLWAQRYDRELSDVFQVQDDITQAIVAALQGALLGSAQSHLTRGTANLDAYDLYLRGRYYWSKRGEEGITKAIQYLSQSAEADPGFARAPAGLSMAYAVLPVFSHANPDSLMRLAAGHAARALALDSSLSEAHLALAYVLKNQWRFADSEREFRAALALAPNDATGHHWYGVFLYATGRVTESIAQMAQARQLDPFGSTIATDGAVALYSAGRFPEAQAELGRSLQLDSVKSDTWLVGGFVSLGEGKGDSAVATLRRARALGSGFDITPYLSVAYRRLGQNGEADRLYQDLRNRREKNPLGTAIAAAAAGDRTVALEALRQTFASRDVLVTELSLPCDPLLAPLHSEPVFTDLLRNAGMVECR